MFVFKVIDSSELLKVFVVQRNENVFVLSEMEMISYAVFESPRNKMENSNDKNGISQASIGAHGSVRTKKYCGCGYLVALRISRVP
ncbi:hypothetical protein RJT34_14771 [Clitoria ternatea]|uniref:Uncharacterized protein n=1 Tax=Clitoria ternatea TaxID=43366 RepID=A0AAN9JT70_CLITE